MQKNLTLLTYTCLYFISSFLHSLNSFLIFFLFLLTFFNPPSAASFIYFFHLLLLSRFLFSYQFFQSFLSLSFLISSITLLFLPPRTLSSSFSLSFYSTQPFSHLLLTAISTNNDQNLSYLQFSYLFPPLFINQYVIYHHLSSVPFFPRICSFPCLITPFPSIHYHLTTLSYKMH